MKLFLLLVVDLFYLFCFKDRSYARVALRMITRGLLDFSHNHIYSMVYLLIQTYLLGTCITHMVEVVGRFEISRRGK